MFRFASPWFFLLLPVIPAALVFRKRRGLQAALGVSAGVGLKGLPASPFIRLKALMPLLKILVFILVVCALARPQWGSRKVSVTTEGVNIVLALDLSESMSALDFRREGKIVNRLEAIKGVVRDFIEKRSGDRIGVVVFGSHAYTQLPLTRDYSTIATILERLEIGAAGKRTAIGDAVGISLKRLEDIQSKSNIIILLTDGSSNEGELTPEAAAEIAVQKKVKIYCVGVGTRGEAPFLVRGGLFGDRYVYQQVEMDEETLKGIAEKTGGLYFRAENIEGLEEIYATIDRLEKTEVKVIRYAEYKEFYNWFLIPAFCGLILWMVLVNTRYLPVP